MRDHDTWSIIAKNLTKSFHHVHNNRTVTAYQSLDFMVQLGEFFSIIGPSGCGKSTLLRTFAGLEQATEGELQFFSPANNTRIAMVFQEPDLLPWMSLRQNIQFFLENNPAFDKQQSQSLTEFYLEQVGLTAFAPCFPHEVSGGMQQRVSIARCFASHADILLLDEPFVFLDYQTRMILYAVLYRIWQDTPRTIVFVTHDVDEAVLLSNRVLVMSKHPGRVVKILDIDLDRSNGLMACKKLINYAHYVDDLNDLLLGDIEV